MEAALANLKLTADAAVDVEFVALDRNELSALDARIVKMIVVSFDLTWPENELGNVEEVASALDRDVMNRQAGDVSLYCLYAYAQFRRLAMCVYEMRRPPVMPAYAAMSKWFEEYATGMNRKTVEEAASAAGHVMSMMALDDDETKHLVCFFSTACYLMEFVNEYR